MFPYVPHYVKKGIQKRELARMKFLAPNFNEMLTHCTIIQQQKIILAKKNYNSGKFYRGFEQNLKSISPT